MTKDQIRDFAEQVYNLNEEDRDKVALMLDDLASVLRTHHALQGALSTGEAWYIANELEDIYNIVTKKETA